MLQVPTGASVQPASPPGASQPGGQLTPPLQPPSLHTTLQPQELVQVIWFWHALPEQLISHLPGPQVMLPWQLPS